MGILSGMGRAALQGAVFASFGAMAGVCAGIAVAGSTKQKYDGVVRRAREAQNTITLDYDPASDTYVGESAQSQSLRGLLTGKWLSADARMRAAVRSFDARLARWGANGVVSGETVLPAEAELVVIPDVQHTLTIWVLGDEAQAVQALHDLETIARHCDYDTAFELFDELSQLLFDKRLDTVFSILAERVWNENSPFGK